MITFKDIVQALTGETISPLGVKISSVVIDSRQAVNDSLFIALPGERTDGHNFVQKAFANGAIAALIDREIPGDIRMIDLRGGYLEKEDVFPGFPLCLQVENTLDVLQNLAKYWREKHPVRTIGITGSVGKTTTKELIAALLAQKYKVLKNPGNLNNEIGLPLTLMSLEDAHQYAVLEMGFYVPGEIRTLCDIAQPQVGVLTNIGTVHAERAGSQQIIAKGKAELVESLPPAPEGIAILNMDDPLVKQMANQTQAEIFSYGINQPADLSARDISSQGLKGLSLKLTFQGESHQVNSPLLGEFSAYTILRAAAVSLVEGLDWESIITGIANTQIPLRMRHFTLPNGAVILDDTYNASPASTKAALELLRKLAGRKIAILGDMLELGAYEESGHYEVGSIAAKAADILILVGERAKMIAKSALEDGFEKKNLYWFPTTEEAAGLVVHTIQEGDIVLIKGSNSMRMDHIITVLEAES